MDKRIDHRGDVLGLLHGRRPSRVPRFSGLIHITAAGLEPLGLRFSEIHTDAHKLAAAAASSYRLFGWESAVVPADLCVEASALGAEVDFRGDAEEPMWPLVARPLAANAADFRLAIPPDLAERERVATVVRALRLLKADIGGEVAVGAWIPGPLTLAMQVVDLDSLYIDIVTRPAEVGRVLDLLTGALAQVGQAYQAAGADFLTIHEMGGSPGVIGPAAFSALMLPRLQRLLARLSTPRVLSVCGKTTAAIPLLAQAGAEALSVDQTCDLAPARSLLGEHTLLFGNLDPVAVLMEGDAAAVRSAAARAIEAGVDAVWPGCDLPPAVPAENMRAFARAG